MKRALLALSITLGIVQGAYLLHWFDRYNLSNGKAISFESHRVEIARLDEILTMSARLHATTGEDHWRQRYFAHVDALSTTLETTLNLAGDDAARTAIASVSEANDQLVAMEDQSFNLVADGQLDAAFSLLTSANYQAQKDRYQQGLEQALAISNTSIKSAVDYHRSALILGAIAVFLSLFMLTELWRRLSLSEQQEVARTIERTLENERRLSGLQRQFVSMVSHEFRTPLAIIDGTAHRLQRRSGEMREEQLQRSTKKIRSAVKRLTDLMESILNLAKLEDDHINIAARDFSLPTLIGEVVASYREVHPDRTITVALESTPQSFVGDASLLGQVVSTLISNALRYSEKGTPVQVEAYLENEEIVIAIHDRGSGMAPSDLEKLGQRFFRGSNATGTAGSGIGLHFAKHIIDLHDGELDVQSVMGKGSSFFVRLPFRQKVVEPSAADIVEPRTLASLPS